MQEHIAKNKRARKHHKDGRPSGGGGDVQSNVLSRHVQKRVLPCDHTLLKIIARARTTRTDGRVAELATFGFVRSTICAKARALAQERDANSDCASTHHKDGRPRGLKVVGAWVNDLCTLLENGMQGMRTTRPQNQSSREVKRPTENSRKIARKCEAD